VSRAPSRCSARPRSTLRIPIIPIRNSPLAHAQVTDPLRRHELRRRDEVVGRLHRDRRAVQEPLWARCVVVAPRLFRDTTASLRRSGREPKRRVHECREAAFFTIDLSATRWSARESLANAVTDGPRRDEIAAMLGERMGLVL
jgi:hypothetical protein